MGRQKGDPNRNKNRPSSSSAAASLLQNSKALSVGFGGYVGSSRLDASENQEKDHQGDVDGEAALHLRRLSKKDSTTRVKALKALIEIFKERPPNELSQLLPNWIFEYKKLVQDDSQQVREGTHNAMSAIAVSVGRGLAPHLRMVMGAWWISQFDPVREVSAAAQQSFQVAFQGPLKRLEALMFCASDVLTHMDGLFKLSPQTISEKSIPIEESTKRYELVISSALLALAAFLDVILQNRSSTLSLGVEPTKIDKESSNEKKHLERRKEVEDLAAKLCLSHKHFRDFAKSKSSQIRCASYQALRAFAQNVSSVFSAEDLDNVGGVVLGSFSDKDPACHAAMWDMVLYISQQYPQAWNTNATKKFVLPRFLSFLRHATYGSAKVSYPCILPLLSLLPLSTIKPALEFLKELFVSLWDGHNGCQMALEDEIIFLKTIQECFLWIINNAERFAANENISVESIQNFMMENVLLEILWKGYVFADSLPRGVLGSKGDGHAKETLEISLKLERKRYTSQFLEKLRVCITDVLGILSSKCDNLTCVFWKRFQDVCFEAVMDEEKHSADSVRIGCVHRLSEFLSQLGKRLPPDDFQDPWLLTQAVRPLVAKLYPMVKVTEFSEAIQLLARIVSIYGPLSFPVHELSQTEEEREAELTKVEHGSFEGEDEELIVIFSFLKNELIPWCLEPFKSSHTEKIELLLSFFEDRRFVGEWQSVLSYALKVEDTESGSNQINCGKVAVLAVLIENFRLKFFDLDRGENCGSGENLSTNQWDLSGLDRTAVAVAGSLSLSDHSSLRLLRNVLGGSMQQISPSLVSVEAVEKIFRLLLQRMLYVLLKSEKEWAKFAASCVLQPDIELPLATAEEEKAVPLACTAAQVICESIRSLEHLNNLEVASKAIAAFYCIHWAYAFLLKREQNTQCDFESENNKSSMDKYTGSSSNSEEDENLTEHGVSLMSVNSLAELESMATNIFSVLSSGFCRNLIAAVRAHVQQMLIHCVRHAVFEGTGDVVRTACTCAKWISALMDQLCPNAEELQQILDMLLEPTNAWPLFAIRPVKFENLPVLVEDQLGLSIHEPRHLRFATLIDKVASLVGWEKLVVHTWPHSLESTLSIVKGKSIKLEAHLRVWLLIEMLCTWHWPGGRAVNSLLPFLVSFTDEEEGQVKETIVNNVVVSLFMSAMSRKKILEFNNKFWMGSNENMENVEDPCLRALLVLLSKICKKSGRMLCAEKFYKMLVIDQGFLEDSLTYEGSKVLPFILSILVPILRKHQETLFSSSTMNFIPLEAAVCKWLHLASSAPPLSSHSNFISDLEHTLQVIAACFPLHSAGGSVAIMAAASAQISSQERALLINLMQKESSDRVGFVAHVAKQYVLPRESSLDTKNARQVHEEILAKLVAASVAYCWKDFKSLEWVLVMNHMRKWLEAALLEAENFTQLVLDTVKMIEKKTSNESSSSAIVNKIDEEIQRASSRKSDLSWTAVILFSLVQATESSTFPGSPVSLQLLESIKWAEGKHRALSYILRIFFASGMAESLVLDSSGGEVAGSIIACSRASDLDFWEIVSEIVLGISNEERIEIARHLNIWTVGKDAPRALYALLFSSQPIGGLQQAAYSLLTSAPFQTSAVTYEDLLLQKDRLEEESVDLESPSLNVANLRRELAVVLESSPARILESTLESPVRVQYFLAWAIFLSHLHTISVSSPVGERLVQYVQDTSISASLLDSIFQHIPLKPETGSSSRRKTSTDFWQAEVDRVGDAARRACTLGSVYLAIEGLWPLEEETVSSLAAGLYGLLLQVLPACVRVWFTGLRDRSAASSVESFTTKFCSPQLLAEEFFQVHNSTVADDSLTIKANQSIGEVTVVYKKEEAGMDMVIRMPKCYPLRAVDIDCTRRLGISETRLRKWMLSMASFLRNQNGAVAEAIQIWKQNVDREFEGVEECPICYSIIHTSNHSLPRLACRTCKHKFHAACLYKWFSTSHKSTCPLCQTPF